MWTVNGHAHRARSDSNPVLNQRRTSELKARGPAAGVGPSSLRAMPSAVQVCMRRDAAPPERDDAQPAGRQHAACIGRFDRPLLPQGNAL